ncbi:hypothetical protein [Enteractinococcus helveticum]|uniref:hypothetical protein n=1 Tax=Enteractinococcus helveticum TaxID=1837282 RepID=UPI001237409C|nr:hypothetical protein [Enteractinococcus helveticum]
MSTQPRRSRSATSLATFRPRLQYLAYVYDQLWLHVVMVGVGVGVLLIHGTDLFASSDVIGLLGWTIIVITVAAAIWHVLSVSKTWRGVRLVQRAQDRTVQTNDDTVVLADAGTSGTEAILRVVAVDEHLHATASTTAIRAVKEPYMLPRPLRSIAPRSFRVLANRSSPDTPNRLPQWLNGKLTRLSEDITATSLTIQPVGFFDGQASNELLGFQYADDPSGASVIHRQMFDQHDQVLSLSESGLANIIGITVFAITADGYVLFVQQGSANAVQSCGYAASGSGSLDWDDVGTASGAARRANKHMSLHELLMTGMCRELAEESQVDANEIVDGSEVVTGFFRWLSRGAKPEFTGLVKLRATMGDLIDRQPDAQEKQYTAGRGWVPIGVLLDDADTWDVRHDGLRQSLARPQGDTSDTHDVVIGVSTMAAWCAAADYIAANRQYLDDVVSQPHDGSTDRLT